MIGSIGRLGCFVLATILSLVRFTRLSPNEDFPIVVVLHGDPLDIIVTENFSSDPTQGQRRSRLE